MAPRVGEALAEGEKMAIDVKQYAEQLAQEAGLSEEDKTAFLKVLGNEKLSKSLGEGVMLRSDYSRNMDELTTQKKRNEDWYRQELAKHNEVLELEKQYRAKLAETGGEEDKPLVATPAFDEKKLREELDQREARTIALFKDGLRLATRHAKDFQEELDTDTLAKLAVEKNLTLAQAYDEMVRPRREEKAKLDFEAKLKAAREEGAREFASTHHVPIDTKPKEHHLIFDKPAEDLPAAGPLRDRARANSFAEAWNEATSGATK